MREKIGELYQAIGEEALARVPELEGTLLLYSEVEDGAVSADLFFERGAGQPLGYRFGSHELQDLIVALWEKWQEDPANSEWRAMAYLIRDGKFEIDLTYADDLEEDETEVERRPRALEKYFNRADVDYSSPE